MEKQKVSLTVCPKCNDYVAVTEVVEIDGERMCTKCAGERGRKVRTQPVDGEVRTIITKLVLRALMKALEERLRELDSNG